MTINQRRERILTQHDRIVERNRLSNLQAEKQGGGQWLTHTVLRLAFLMLVVGTLGGTWLVIDAHLAEQFLGVPKHTQGLIDRYAGQGALTPEYIEQQILHFNLRLKEDDLAVPAGIDPNAATIRHQSW